MTEAETQAEEPTDAEIREAWLETLAEIYMSTDFDELTGNKTAYVSFFERKMTAVTGAGSVDRMIKSLCGKLGTEVPQLPTGALDLLHDNDEHARDVFAAETVYLANKTKEAVAAYWDDYDGQGDSVEDVQNSKLSEYISETEG